jgi:hypothetical protein
MYGCLRREYDKMRSFDTGGSYLGMPNQENILKFPYTTVKELQDLYSRKTSDMIDSSQSMQSNYKIPIMIGYAPGTSGSGTPGLSDSHFAQIASARETKGWQGH